MKNVSRQLNIPIENIQICKSAPGKRILAKIFDGFIETAILIVLVLSFVKVFEINKITDIITLNKELILFATIYQIIILILNLIIPVVLEGRTIGKLITNIRIIHIDGNVGNIIIYLVRQSFFTVIALLGQIQVLANLSRGILIIIYIICFIEIFSNEYGRTIQDRFARTMVVDNAIWLKYREKAFYEMDHPTPFLEESSTTETLDNEAMPNAIEAL